MKETLLQITAVQKERAELDVFWAEIADNLPKSLERSALGDEVIFSAFAIAYPKIKKHLVANTLKQAAEALSHHEFQMNIDEYLPRVKAWQGGYDRPFDDGYAQALTDAQKVLLGEDND
jgi:hypothetical protein